jgi:hypothetical protein
VPSSTAAARDTPTRGCALDEARLERRQRAAHADDLLEQALGLGSIARSCSSIA